MGLFKKLFAADHEGLEKKADALYAAGDFGPAKLIYERALGAAPDEARTARPGPQAPGHLPPGPAARGPAL